jgi:hypothetical protein
VFDVMAGVLAAGCGSEGGKVTCPAGGAEAGKHQLVLEIRGGVWKITSFVQAE